MKILSRFFATLLLVLMMISLNQAQQGGSNPQWTQWQFLIGEWQAVGKGSPGEIAGGFSIEFDLQKRVIVRKRVFRQHQIIVDDNSPRSGSPQKFSESSQSAQDDRPETRSDTEEVFFCRHSAEQRDD